jgi:hypothetical protein
LAQQPDNVIQLAEDNQLHILDAKYRVGADLAYLRQFESPGPTADDINTMHRYRDAIVLASGRPAEYERGVVKSAIVLFPLSPEDGYEGHRFLKSVGEVQIGGLPFLPGATRLVESYLRSLLV